MGGNALKLATVRLEKEYYDHVAEGMLSTLKTAFPKALINVIPSYKEKLSHGDLDILISGPNVNELTKFCKEALNSPEIHNNGGVISFGLDITGLLFKRAIFQVDLITVPEEDFNFALNYFAYNDLGNLIGQTAHGIGLKFGHDGLWYKYIIDTQLVKEICITKDFKVALDILGYGNKYQTTDFNTTEDIFTFAISSPYFSTWNYQLENRNHVGRIRDKKRKTYMEFLEWMKGKQLPSERRSKDLGLKVAAELKPHVAQEFMHATLDYFRTERVKNKFNGELVSRLTGLTGKELGGFMSDYRGDNREAFMSKMERFSTEQVEADIVSSFEMWSKQ